MDNSGGHLKGQGHDSKLLMTSTRTDESRAGAAYQRIAADLLGAIGRGSYGVGDRLPTEAQLCEQFRVSRFTVRAALAQLERRGVVKRRPRIGTQVTAVPAGKSYQVAVGSLSELLSFLDVTTVRPVGSGELAADAALAADLHCAEGTRWLRVETLRTPTGSDVPISWTTYYFQPRFAPIVKLLGRKPGPVYPLLEKRFKVSIESIEQEIGACQLDRKIAGAVSAKAGAAALRVIHRLLAAGGGALYCTVSVYPAERFRYVQRLQARSA